MITLAPQPTVPTFNADLRDLRAFAWPLDTLGDALVALAQAAGLAPRAADLPGVPCAHGEPGANDRLDRWIEAATDWLGIEAEPVEYRYAELAGLLRADRPLLFRLPGDSPPLFVAVLRGGRRMVTLLGPNLERQRIIADDLHQILAHAAEAQVGVQIDQMLLAAETPARQVARARAALLRERLGPLPLGHCWQLRLPPGASFTRQVLRAGGVQCVVLFALAYAAQYVLGRGAWWVVGEQTLRGGLAESWFMLWALLLVLALPCRLLSVWLQGRLAYTIGGLLRGRMLAGALRMSPDAISHQGVGQLLGRAIELETLTSLASSSGTLGLIAAIELGIVASALSFGAAGGLHSMVLLLWLAGGLGLGWAYLRARRSWTDARRTMTHDLIEQMAGHRTRLVQEAPERRHDLEDQRLARYLDLSQAMDRHAARLALLPHGWLLLSLGLIGWALLDGNSGLAALAVAVDGTLSAALTLRRLVDGLPNFSNTALAWQQIAPLFQAAAQPEPQAAPDALIEPTPRPATGEAPVVLDAHQLTFRYRQHGAPVLQGCSLQIRQGERVLLEGSSGGGKSTLAALLAAQRTPESGLLLLRGLDLRTLGAGQWRRYVAAAPQFHQNHVLAETFAFNLLMGRRWPPRPADLAEAEEVCVALGLGDLLERMPAGLFQIVGDTGWQLSHGEKSRLYLARALLQGAELIVLDESFAALDPETLRQALRYVRDRAPTLLVIAHP